MPRGPASPAAPGIRQTQTAESLLRCSYVARRAFACQAVRVELQARADGAQLVEVVRDPRGPRPAVEPVLRLPQVQLRAHRAGEIQELPAAAQAVRSRPRAAPHRVRPP